MKLKDMAIGRRLALAFRLIGCVFLAMVLGANAMMSLMNDKTEEIVHQREPAMELTSGFEANLSALALAIRNMMLTNDDADRQRQFELIMQSRREADDALAALAQHLVEPEARDVLTRMGQTNAAYIVGQDMMVKLIQGGQIDAAIAYLNSDLRPQLVALRKEIGAQMALQKKYSVAAAAASAKLHQTTGWIMWISAVVAIALGGLIAWLLSRSITGPMHEAVAIARKVAQGDLTSEINVRSGDETGQLLQSLKEMNAQLAATVGSVRLGSDTIAVAAAQVAAGNQDLSSRTEHQASALEQTAASMEELTSTVKQNADNARQANVLAESASKVAEQGGAVIARVVGTMDDINASASKISDIIGVIDGIAFQTNILALNAAVEAARAGEQGRGFAVVASEVRNLAQRSAAAAREIKALIGDSTSKTAAGSALVVEAGATMTEIVDSVRRVTDIMAEISAASHEQTAGIDQINQAVCQLDESTQQNAALVEQAAAASGSMQEQATRLAEAVSVFRLAPSDRPTGAGLAARRSTASRLLVAAA